jgi:hypothetical protein
MSMVDRIWHTDEVERPLKIAKIKKQENKESSVEVGYEKHNDLKGNKRMEQKNSGKGILHWTNPVRELDVENLNKQPLKTEDAYDVLALNDEISEAANHQLTKPSIMRGILEPLTCEKLMKTFNWLLENLQPDGKLPQVEKDKLLIAGWSTLLMSSNKEYGEVLNHVIEAVMPEVARYNEQQGGGELKGVWDVPRFLSMETGQGGLWYNELGIGSAESMKQVQKNQSSSTPDGQIHTHVEWNGMPPPSTRKITTLICLSDGGSYDGGDLELLCDEVKTMKMNVGDCILYPSFIPTRFLPVTRGKLVCLKIYSNGKSYV